MRLGQILSTCGLTKVDANVGGLISLVADRYVSLVNNLGEYALS
jgi:hypothetical protein